ncbi:hypothetical protein [Microbacterium oleivorans]|uniref:Uncharacterized protein n=1 Tax=Microbacterium oleivorans TaxID=273677 RepID=A0A7D5EZA2_9MICO|nr:hypothetical protein [Microbacterium oleivorans]QLD13130.1 hypothetical protein HW566_15930 [Microbacterium oleivorans]
MSHRAQLIIALGSSAILFLSIAFVFVLVVTSLFTGGIDFPGEPEIADAAGLAAWGLIA